MKTRPGLRGGSSNVYLSRASREASEMGRGKVLGWGARVAGWMSWPQLSVDHNTDTCHYYSYCHNCYYFKTLQSLKSVSDQAETRHIQTFMSMSVKAAFLHTLLAISEQEQTGEGNRGGMFQKGVYQKCWFSKLETLWGKLALKVSVDDGLGRIRSSVFHPFCTNKVLMLKF